MKHSPSKAAAPAADDSAVVSNGALKFAVQPPTDWLSQEQESPGAIYWDNNGGEMMGLPIMQSRALPHGTWERYNRMTRAWLALRLPLM